MNVLAAARAAHNDRLDTALNAAEAVGFQLFAAVSVATDSEKADTFFGSWAGEVALARFRRGRA